MLSFRDISSGIRKLEIDPQKPVIIHASLSSFGEIRGGAETLLGGLLANFQAIMAPTFTYKTMLTPESGPANNGISYGSAYSQNRMAEFFTPTMPCDRMMGVLPERLRLHPKATRSTHPILSFAGINLEQTLATQTLSDPFLPIQSLNDQGGYVLLLGVDHTVNTSIHLAEKRAGRKTFIRWALTPKAVIECKGFPGCSEGFNKVEPFLEEITHSLPLGESQMKCISIPAMVDILESQVKSDPFAFLCEKETCPRCAAIRQHQTQSER